MKAKVIGYDNNRPMGKNIDMCYTQVPCKRKDVCDVVSYLRLYSTSCIMHLSSNITRAVSVFYLSYKTIAGEKSFWAIITWYAGAARKVMETVRDKLLPCSTLEAGSVKSRHKQEESSKELTTLFKSARKTRYAFGSTQKLTSVLIWRFLCHIHTCMVPTPTPKGL